MIYENNISILFPAPISIGLFFGFPYLMYRFGQWGGGDVKLMTGLGIIFTSLSLSSNLSFINLFINILLFGGIYGLIATLIYGLVKFKRLRRELKFYDIPIIVMAFLFIIFSFVYFKFPYNLFISFIIFLLFAIRYLYLVMDKLMYIEVSTNKLMEGDWLMEDVIKDGKVIVSKRNIGLTKDDIEKLKKEKIEHVMVKIGLPFVPGILVGLLITIFLVNPIISFLLI